MFGLGLAIGDMVGEPYEFSGEKMKTMDFNFLDKEMNTYTDDSVMALAVCEGVLNAVDNLDKKFMKASIQKSMTKWGRKYRDVGYGAKFYWWIFSEEQKPYSSWGNGSAMRVGFIPWIFKNNLDRCLEVAEIQAKITHNHPEGVKGAVSIAHVIWLAINGVEKSEIRQMVIEKYYPLEKSCDVIRERYKFDVSCQGTCPVAIRCFLDSWDFESAVRLAISMGGDADTLGAITGAIAEAYYGVPYKYQKIALEILPKDLKDIVLKFNNYLNQEF